MQPDLSSLAVASAPEPVQRGSRLTLLVDWALGRFPTIHETHLIASKHGAFLSELIEAWWTSAKASEG
jgi:hypothetical protein